MDSNFIQRSFKDKQKTLFNRVVNLKRNATVAELCIINKLSNLNVKYIFQKGFIAGDYYCIVDFYFPKPHKLCLEIDGGYHFSEAQIKRDKRKDDYLKGRKLNVYRITNEYALKITVKELTQLILTQSKNFSRHELTP